MKLQSADLVPWIPFVGAHGGKLLRLKGNIDFGAGVVFVELVGKDVSEKPAAALKGPATSFTAIAWGRTKEELQAALEKTLS